MRYRNINKSLSSGIIGIVVGYCSSQFLYYFLTTVSCSYKLDAVQMARITAAESQFTNYSKSNKGLVLIGIMTAAPFINTRVKAVHETWARNVPGKLMFFTSEESKEPEDKSIPVIRLPGIDDAYPPQKKALAMIKYMHDHYLDKFHFFMRADDDAHMRFDLLVPFLNSISNDVPRFVGQPGQGIPEEKGEIGLTEDERFCMGGPGVVFNNIVLSGMGPNVHKCIKEFFTWHEDIEFWRCAKIFGSAASCTKNYEWKDAFYNYGGFEKVVENGARLKNVLNIISIHALKKISLQYKFDVYMKSLQIKLKELKITKALEEISFHSLEKMTAADNARTGYFYPFLRTATSQKKGYTAFIYDRYVSFNNDYLMHTKYTNLSLYHLKEDFATIVVDSIHKQFGQREIHMYERYFPGMFAEYYYNIRYTRFRTRILSDQTRKIIIHFGSLFTEEVSSFQKNNKEIKNDRTFEFL